MFLLFRPQTSSGTPTFSRWKPHQAITVHDSLLTDSVPVQMYIANVSGTIDGRDVIEWEVEVGAPARSIVQTVIDSE
jgi:hypothetical protein